MARPITQETVSTKSKRKIEEDDDEETLKKAQVVSASAETTGRKRKKRKKAKQPCDDAKDGEEKCGIDESIGNMDGKLLADYFAQKAKKHNKDLTTVELDDIYVPDYAFLDTSSWQSPRSLEQLPSFLKKHSPNILSQASEAKGSPHTLVVTLAGLRAADLTRWAVPFDLYEPVWLIMTRALRQFQNKECIVGKLFAKHIKLAEAQEFVKKTRSVLQWALNLDSLKQIVIDGSYIDQKKRGIFDMKDLHFPLLKFLNRADLRDRYKSKNDKVNIVVF
ncbi:Protein cms1 [Emydomyces testavorans]|uniref:Protein cms1 n=1 Tax=Emydomyces testavorans TaxID=2070801 RepID=A0AAF0DFA3_9EURO|nr:Protein cms1 [Emydomyces testavorans]